MNNDTLEAIRKRWDISREDGALNWLHAEYPATTDELLADVTALLDEIQRLHGMMDEASMAADRALAKIDKMQQRMLGKLP